MEQLWFFAIPPSCLMGFFGFYEFSMRFFSDLINGMKITRKKTWKITDFQKSFRSSEIIDLKFEIWGTSYRILCFLKTNSLKFGTFPFSSSKPHFQNCKLSIKDRWLPQTNYHKLKLKFLKKPQKSCQKILDKHLFSPQKETINLKFQ